MWRWMRGWGRSEVSPPGRANFALTPSAEKTAGTGHLSAEGPDSFLETGPLDLHDLQACSTSCRALFLKIELHKVMIYQSNRQ